MKREILLILFMITSACAVENFSQDVWSEIPRSSFESGTYIEDTSYFYHCIQCDIKIEYLRKKDSEGFYRNGEEFFHIGIDTFLVGSTESLEENTMKFYYVRYNKLKYLVITSRDFGVLGNSYAYILNYHVFELDEKNKRVSKYFSLPLSRLSKEEAFKTLVKR